MTYKCCNSFSLSGFYSPRYGENKFTVNSRNIAVPLCEMNKIYSYYSDSSSSERTMDLVLEMCNTNSIHWCGISGRQLGKLHPSSSLSLALTLLSSVQGLQVCCLFKNSNIWGLLTYKNWFFNASLFIAITNCLVQNESYIQKVCTSKLSNN